MEAHFWHVEWADTGEHADIGPNPLGYLILTAERRLMALLTAEDHTPPKDGAEIGALAKTMLAYTGMYHVEGDDKLVTIVDAAAYPAWNGTEQLRLFKLDGSSLSITTPDMPHGAFPDRLCRGVSVWLRE